MNLPALALFAHVVGASLFITGVLHQLGVFPSDPSLNPQP